MGMTHVHDIESHSAGGSPDVKMEIDEYISYLTGIYKPERV
jgi:hypothetical protein